MLPPLFLEKDLQGAQHQEMGRIVHIEEPFGKGVPGSAPPLVKGQQQDGDECARVFDGIWVVLRIYIEYMVVKQSEKGRCQQGEDVHAQQDDQAVCEGLVLEVSVKIVQHKDHEDACAAPVRRDAENDQSSDQQYLGGRVLEPRASPDPDAQNAQKDRVDDVRTHKGSVRQAAAVSEIQKREPADGGKRGQPEEVLTDTACVMVALDRGKEHDGTGYPADDVHENGGGGPTGDEGKGDMVDGHGKDRDVLQAVQGEPSVRRCLRRCGVQIGHEVPPL